MKLTRLITLVAVPAALAAQGTKQAKAPAAAPAPAPAATMTIPAGAVGTWENKAMTGPKDSVVATNTTIFGADGKITVQFPNRPSLAGRLIAAGSDSVTTEVGPYESVVKKGLTTTTRTTSHFKGNTSTGTFSAKYSDGTTLNGKLSGTKKADTAKPTTKKP